MPRHIVLLRGINLGAHRRVPMARLRSVLEQAGHRGVRTLLQSGNVVLTSDDDAATLEHELPGVLRASFGMDIDAIVRSRDELAAAVGRDPFEGRAGDPKLYQITFLAGALDPHRARSLENADVAPERVMVHGREVYSWHPDGIARSALAKMLTEKALGVSGTARNRRTLLALLTVADE